MNVKIAIIGLGYVGLPLAVEFAKKYPTVGFDINEKRVSELMNGYDITREVEYDALNKVIDGELSSIYRCNKGLFCTSDLANIQSSNFFIITVPTPIDINNRPLLSPLLKASESVGKVLKPGDHVIYESTVYPGATEDNCIPVLEEYSDLIFNQDFFVGYSPERINPGDKERTLTKIVKVTSGSTPQSARTIDNLYGSIIEAGTYMAPSIKVAEAAKVIENCQRDINIAFVNELAKIFNRLEIDTHSVLEAAGTKWNFLSFKPGLVGGHCIGVDPYYLAQKAQEVGYHPEIILTGRRLNDDMGKYVANELIKLMIKHSLPITNSNILMLGITFKENCPDIRNTRAIDIYNELRDYGVNIDVYDPWADKKDVKNEFDIDLRISQELSVYDAIILVVAHKEFKDFDFVGKLTSTGVIYDVKGVLPKKNVTKRL